MGASSEPGPDKAEPVISSAEMFEVVVAAVKAALHDPPHKACVATVAELYGDCAELYTIAHDTVAIAADLILAGKQRFPTLLSEEKGILLKVFEEACIESNGSFMQWTQCAQTATEDLYNSNWSFNNIMQSMISKVKWARARPMNQ
ncbi:hypothetical protein CCR75_001147 [Bremia lactucae]|uniref:Uncharacterized protein n=1 Tax=Bremia lactucae TaxID=4779 RepID=A0A976IGI5_BRELC|nr:hypothetical protein CCR75_001147 [Bremia lactucae]